MNEEDLAATPTSNPFVYCVKCYSSTFPLNLTSCGHIVCPRHSKGNTCSICNTPQITFSPLSPSTAQNLPNDQRSFFTSFLPSLQDIHAVARYQYTRLVDLVHHQRKVITKLNNKISSQRESTNTMKAQLVKAKAYKS